MKEFEIVQKIGKELTDGQLREAAAKALRCLPLLRGTDAHCSVILSSDDAAAFRKLGIRLTTEPDYEDDNLYHI